MGILNLSRMLEIILCAIVVARLRYIYNLDITMVYLFIVLEIYLLTKNINLKWYKFYYIIIFLMIDIVTYKLDIININNIGYLVYVFVLFLIIEGEMKVNIEAIRRKLRENKKLIEGIRGKNIELKIKESEINQLLKRYKDEVNELYLLKVIGNFINTSLEEDVFIENVIDALVGVINFNFCCVILYNENGQIVETYVKMILCDIDRVEIIEMIKNDIDKNFKDNTGIYIKNQNDYNECLNSNIIIPICKRDIKYGEIILAHKDNNYFNDSNINLLEDIRMQVALALENVILYKKVKKLAVTDNLTKLYNRNYLEKLWPFIVKKATEANQNLVVAMVDIDDFKFINDNYGHIFGDQVLRDLARITKKFFETYEGKVIRYGGEELLILILKMEKEVANKILDEYREKIQKHVVKFNSIEKSITISIGFTIYPLIEKNIDKAIDSADKALYSSKHSGKNRVTLAKETK